MTLSRIAATGRGRISARLVIEGLGIEIVSAKRMARAVDDGRERVAGLDLAGMVLSASADIMRATVEAQTLSVKIRDLTRIAGKRHGKVTQHFVRAPQRKLFLASDVTAAATSIMLRSVTGLASSGVVHIGTEAIRYTGISTTTLTGCTRGAWDTTAQAHFARDGEGLLDALVTDVPTSIEGRRARLYLYGDGDDPQGDGTLRWQGIVATEAMWGGGVVTFSVDPMTRVLAQRLGSGGAEVPTRGVKYTSSAPFTVSVVEYPSGLPERVATSSIAGFFDGNDEFCAELTATLASLMTDAGIDLDGGALTAQPRGDTIEIVYTTTSLGTPPVIAVYCRDGYVHARDGLAMDTLTHRAAWLDETDLDVARMGDREWEPGTERRYHVTIEAPVPRGTVGRYAWWDPGRTLPATSLESLEYLIPLGGLAVPDENSVLVPMDDGWSEDGRPLRVYSASGRDVYILAGSLGRALRAYDARTAFAIGLFIASGSVIDMLDELIVDSPDLCNGGGIPLVLISDILPTNELETAAEASRLANNRSFYVFSADHTLGDVVEPELRALSAYQRIGLTGALEWDLIRPPLTTDAATWTIDDSAGTAALEKAPHGVLGHVVYRMDYDPREDEWGDRTITFRDVQSTSATRAPIALEIAQLSTSGGYETDGRDIETLDRSELARVAMAAFGLFGTPVVVVVVQLDARYADARIGDAVSLSARLLPDIEDGVSEVSGRAGIVVSHAYELASGRVTLGVLMHTQAFAGYHVGLPISSSSGSSTTWTLTVNLADYLFAPDGSPDAASVLAVGDLVRVTQGDAEVPTEISGTVTSVSGTIVGVEFASAWTPGSDEWWLRARGASSYDRGVGLARYAFSADSAHTIGFDDGDAEGQVFA